MSSFFKLIFALVASIAVAVGCASRNGATKSSTANTAKTNQVTVTPALSAVGRVASVNRPSRFVVVGYPIGSEPPLRQKLNVYRNNLKVAELIVTGPQSDGNTVADIVTGEVQVGDEVRED